MRKIDLTVLGLSFLVTVQAHALELSYGYQLNRAHTGHSVISASFQPPLVRKWTRNLTSSVSYPIIANGLVFVTTGYADHGTCKEPRGSTVIALDLGSGATVWSYKLSDYYCIAHAAYDAGRLFVADVNSNMYSYTADRAGKLVWSKELLSQGETPAPPMAYNGQVFVLAAGGGTVLLSLDETNGREKWRQLLGDGDESSPTLGDGGVYISVPCQAFKFALKGDLLWHYDDGCSGGGGTTSAYSAGRVYSFDSYTDGAIFHAEDGEVVGHLPFPGPLAFWSDAQGHQSAMMVNDGVLSSISPFTGKQNWTFKRGGDIIGPPIVVNDNVVVTSFDSSRGTSALFLVDAATGARLWKTYLPGTPFQQYGLYTGLGVGLDTLVVPNGSQLTAYIEQPR